MDHFSSINATSPDSVTRSPLLRNLLVFGRVLRSLGLPVTSGQIIELATSLSYINIARKEDFQNAARCILVNRREHLVVFDHAFDLFWRAWSQGTATAFDEVLQEIGRSDPGSLQTQRGGSSGNSSRREDRRHREPRLGTVSEGQEEAGDQDQIALTMYSAGEILRHKDFSHFSGAELADAQRFLAAMRWSITRRRSLRTRPARRGRRLDVRRSMRQSLRHGGEMLDLAYRRPKLKRRQLVLLCDISGSMDRYTQLLLHFLHSIEASAQRAEVFVFGTRLTRVTRELQRRDPDSAIAAAAEHVQDWSGGTRIGESLHTFNHRWARRVLGHGAIVMIISDGWDRGDAALLAREMQRLQRQSYRLIWLNPLLGSTNYRPLTQGIQAALPYVDDFLPVHNLASLEALAILLNDIQEGRPARRQAGTRQAEGVG